jgi:class 3 adenylate cyclase
MQDDHVTSEPILLTVAVVLIFVFTSMVFFLYDWLVERRQKKVMKTAVQSSAIVSSLFPSQVRDRLFPMDDAKADADKGNTPKGFRVRNNVAKAASSPVADLYPESTVMFADIAGFTAWSSVREPKQVFTLLETLYGAFDSIADRRGVFKVETIGDSYVAVVGLPEPRKDHAVVMARFARDCRNDMNRLTRELEITLGPNTNDLQLRFGLHSGPVTAGVLRGQKSRFQLFGDTVNTAARMESNGIRNRIQVSQTTADILIAAGKEHWVTKRDELVSAKGKGKMQTYWVDPKSAGGSVPPSIPQPNESIKGLSIIDDKKQRLVNWNSEVLGRLMRQIVAKRNASSKVTTFEASSMGISSATILPVGATVLDEVKDFIELPEFDAAVVRNQEEPESIEMNDVVPSQLREYVFTVATMYHENLFHNFEHASHVAMSVVKLLSCTFTPEGDAFSGSQQKIASSCHDNTYGIMSDPLTQFACVFSALIHDVDHTGVPNTQLVKENHHIAAAYKGKSVAEQNSFDLAWNTFMDERFNELRNTLCATEEELGRFRQLVVNSVMATDIMDNELKTLRNARWDKAFLEAPQTLGSDRDTVNRKATIVIEHLMQASDIAHTMQHFDIYQKWNELLFAEMYEAYDTGRADKDPSELWYLGELEFFDFCIIPLATKIRECGAFGVTGDEYLACAIKNRQEWEVEGEDVVASMLEKYKGNRAVEQGSL